ncbi:sugar transferase [Kitasatospora sp. NPDC127111]|uniref:sugar transferase n=1 Tax=Kitasatospora sp. NPDC127111 TaxID=3345363 RepID=UPI00363ED7DD
MGVIGPGPRYPSGSSPTPSDSQRQRGRLDVRPGLPLAQVQGRHSIGWAERIELDLWSVQHRSLLLDARILVGTDGVLLNLSGITTAGGVNPGFPVPTEPADTPSHQGAEQPVRPLSRSSRSRCPGRPPDRGSPCAPPSLRCPERGPGTGTGPRERPRAGQDDRHDGPDRDDHHDRHHH